MKLLFLLILLASCSTFQVNDYSRSIPQVQFCWKLKSVACIKEHFGIPQKVTEESFSYIKNENEYLTIFYRNKDILAAQFWLYDPAFSNAKAIKQLLSSQDWSTEKIEEKNPHVVNLAEANFSKKLGTSFLTYQLDKKKSVRVIYWGGDYKSLEL
jgi:hypothetical protein